MAPFYQQRSDLSGGAAQQNNQTSGLGAAFSPLRANLDLQELRPISAREADKVFKPFCQLSLWQTERCDSKIMEGTLSCTSQPG